MRSPSFPELELTPYGGTPRNLYRESAFLALGPDARNLFRYSLTSPMCSNSLGIFRLLACDVEKHLYMDADAFKAALAELADAGLIVTGPEDFVLVVDHQAFQSHHPIHDKTRPGILKVLRTVPRELAAVFRSLYLEESATSTSTNTSTNTITVSDTVSDTVSEPIEDRLDRATLGAVNRQLAAELAQSRAKGRKLQKQLEGSAAQAAPARRAVPFSPSPSETPNGNGARTGTLGLHDPRPKLPPAGRSAPAFVGNGNGEEAA